MGRTTVSTTSYSGRTNTSSHSESQSQSRSQSQSATQKVLDERLRDRILAGLTGGMTDEEIERYAQNLLRPALDAELEASQQRYETTKLGKEQEIDRLAAALERSIREQERAHARSAAQVQTAALARGMGRSSYALQTLANEGREHARTIGELTAQSDEQSGRLQAQITQAAQHNAATQGRLNADYAQNLAAKVQELREQQRKESNSNYLAAVAGSMGAQTTGSQSTSGSSTTDTTGTSRTSGSSTTTTTSGSGGSRRTAATSDRVDAVSSAAPSVRRR